MELICGIKDGLPGLRYRRVTRGIRSRRSISAVSNGSATFSRYHQTHNITAQGNLGRGEWLIQHFRTTWSQGRLASLSDLACTVVHRWPADLSVIVLMIHVEANARAASPKATPSI
jgi:hypothetical protein